MLLVPRSKTSQAIHIPGLNTMFLLSGKVNSDVDDCWNAHALDMLGSLANPRHAQSSPHTFVSSSSRLLTCMFGTLPHSFCLVSYASWPTSSKAHSYV